MPKIPNWNLNKLYEADAPKLKEDLEKLDTGLENFALWKDKLANLSLEEFKVLINNLEEITVLAYKISGFSHLRFAENTQDQEALSFMGQIDELMANFSNQLLFFEIWWQDLAEEKAEKFIQDNEKFSYFLRDLQKFKKHTLSEAEEKIINLKNITGNSALVTLYDSITNNYKYKIKEKDEELSRDELMVYARDFDKEKRKAAYQELYRVYGENGPTLGQIYQTRVRDWQIEKVNLRKYESPVAYRNKANGLSDKVVESLLKVCQEKAFVFNKFFQLKAKALALESFTRYDLYAPLTFEEKVYSFQDGWAQVIEAFRNFSPNFETLAENILKEEHLSAKPQLGKQGGAFCASIGPTETPWVLMSFNGRKQDLFTLAHELGHGVHSQLAKEHNVFHFHATLPLAETASTFSEMLLANSLLNKLTNKKDKAALLFHILDDAYATIGRQAFFALFEIEAHNLINGGATVTQLAEAYYKNLEKQFANSVLIAEEFKWEWVSIPHFYHSPFYVYAYSFGQLLVYSLWRLYEKEGPKFAQRLEKILACGGSARPEDILKESGIGPLNEEFWQGGFEVINGFLNQLEEYLN